MTDPLVVAAEVRDAVAAGAPVLALESTIFTHGLPRPRNLEVALDAEARVRRLGVVPAPGGVVVGRPPGGRSPAAMERRATGRDRSMARNAFLKAAYEAAKAN